MGDREAPEWVGEQSRHWDTVFNRELFIPGFFQIWCLMALLSSHLLAPAVCFHSGSRERLHVCGMCVALWGWLSRRQERGGGGSVFLSIAYEINRWVWSGLFVREGWSLRRLIVTVN